MLQLLGDEVLRPPAGALPLDPIRGLRPADPCGPLSVFLNTPLNNAINFFKQATCIVLAAGRACRGLAYCSSLPGIR
jgi:hypothetical protein